MIIDFEYAKKERQAYLRTYKEFNNINVQRDMFEVPMRHILSLHANLAEIINAWIDNGACNQIVLEQIVLFLSKIGELSILLNLDLVKDIEELQIEPIEVNFNKLFSKIAKLENKKKSANKFIVINYIVPLFAELVYSLGFSLRELEEAYKEIIGG